LRICRVIFCWLLLHAKCRVLGLSEYLYFPSKENLVEDDKKVHFTIASNGIKVRIKKLMRYLHVTPVSIRGLESSIGLEVVIVSK